MPQFCPTLFVLENYEPTEIDSSHVSSDDEDEEPDKKSKRGDEEDDEDNDGSEREQATAKKQRVEPDEGPDGDQLVYPPSLPVMGKHKTAPNPAKILTPFVEATDENFRPPTPIPSLLLQPERSAVAGCSSSIMTSTIEEEPPSTTATPNVFTTKFRIVRAPSMDTDIEMSESSR